MAAGEDCYYLDFSMGGVVDLLDFAEFQRRHTGDQMPPAGDLDRDFDIDLDDFALWSGCLNGPNRVQPAPPGCPNERYFPSDLDDDGDVDLADFARLQAALAGP
jgi:hypothetical protein